MRLFINYIKNNVFISVVWWGSNLTNYYISSDDLQIKKSWKIIAMMP